VEDRHITLEEHSTKVNQPPKLKYPSVSDSGKLLGRTPQPKRFIVIQETMTTPRALVNSGKPSCKARAADRVAPHATTTILPENVGASGGIKSVGRPEPNRNGLDKPLSRIGRRSMNTQDR
jgi:hypothetical protein